MASDVELLCIVKDISLQNPADVDKSGDLQTENMRTELFWIRPFLDHVAPRTIIREMIKYHAADGDAGD